MYKFSKGLIPIISIFLSLSVVACSRSNNHIHAANASTINGDDSVSVMIDSVNYLHDGSFKYTLYDLSQEPMQAVGGAMVNLLASGGEKGCCISLPRKWQPGMKVRIVWQEADRVNILPGEKSRDIEIPQYDTPADLYVVFNEDHDVELVVSAAEPGNPAWRGRIKNDPWNQCVEKYGEKVCKWSLPKRFDRVGNIGFCTAIKRREYSDAENLCSSAMYECMESFEDEEVCRGILWAPVPEFSMQRCMDNMHNETYCDSERREEERIKEKSK